MDHLYKMMKEVSPGSVTGIFMGEEEEVDSKTKAVRKAAANGELMKAGALAENFVEVDRVQVTLRADMPRMAYEVIIRFRGADSRSSDQVLSFHIDKTVFEDMIKRGKEFNIMSKPGEGLRVYNENVRSRE